MTTLGPEDNMSRDWSSCPVEVQGCPAPCAGWHLAVLQVLQLPQAAASYKNLQAFKVVVFLLLLLFPYCYYIDLCP